MNVVPRPRWIPYLVVTLVLAAACFLVGNLFVERSVAQEPAADALAAPDASGTCDIETIATFENRIHVRCKPSSGGIGATIVYFAAPTSDSRQTNRLLAMLMTAYVLNIDPWVYWNSSSSANPSGCISTNCRLLEGVEYP